MTRRLSRFAGLVAGLAVLSSGLAACGSSDSAASDDGKIQIVASTNVWGAVAQEVGGDRVAVTSIIDSPDKDPHEYETTPADAAAVGKAQLLLRNGGGYDEFMTKLVDASGNTAPVIDAYTIEQQQGTAPDRSNEHVWYDVSVAGNVAETMSTELSRIDPAGDTAYKDNARRFADELTGLYARTRAIGEAFPGAAVAVTEPVPEYMLTAAGLTDATPPEFSEAIEEGNDPPAAVVAETLALFSPQPKVKALVLNAQTQTPATDQIRQAATAAGVPVVEVTETLPAGTTDYTTWMTGQVDTLFKALGGRP